MEVDADPILVKFKFMKVSARLGWTFWFGKGDDLSMTSWRNMVGGAGFYLSSPHGFLSITADFCVYVCRILSMIMSLILPSSYYRIMAP